MSSREERTVALVEAIADLCKAKAEHAVQCHEYRHADSYPSESECRDAWDHLYKTMLEVL